MVSITFAGPLIRLLRMERNWSQETLCRGVCAVSYLSKIEQGKVEANIALLEPIFQRLGVAWQENPDKQRLCEELYEGIFAWDDEAVNQEKPKLAVALADGTVGPWYPDLLVIQAFLERDPQFIPEGMALPEPRQRCLLALARENHEEAYRILPCALTACCIAEEAYYQGNYTYALEYLQIAYDQASREGYAHIMMICQGYMANCYADIGNLDAMERHNRIAARLARALGNEDMIQTTAYNAAATQAEFGDYALAYDYFSAREQQNILSLHKLAICCEGLGKQEEALAALDRAKDLAPENTLEQAMCDLVRYRLAHPDHLQDAAYGRLLMDTFRRIRKERHFGFARFHLKWVTQWLTANRQYREAYELMADFTKNTI